MNKESFGDLLLLLSSGLFVLPKGIFLEYFQRPPYALNPHQHLLNRDPHSYKIWPTPTIQPHPLSPSPCSRNSRQDVFSFMTSKMPNCHPTPGPYPGRPLLPAIFCWDPLLFSLGCLLLSQLGLYLFLLPASSTIEPKICYQLSPSSLLSWHLPQTKHNYTVSCVISVFDTWLYFLQPGVKYLSLSKDDKPHEGRVWIHFIHNSFLSI